MNDRGQIDPVVLILLVLVILVVLLLAGVIPAHAADHLAGWSWGDDPK